MIELLTAAQSRELDALAHAAGVSEEQLIKRAGRRAAQIIAKLYSPCRVHILCGGGNNGADGLVVAENLTRASFASFDCRVFLLKDNPHRHLWSGPVYPLDKADHSKAELVVDALFGTGLTRALSAELLALAQTLDADIVSLDMPSGFNSDTGAGPEKGKGFYAQHTISFVRPKPAHFLLPAKEASGAIHIADIGLDAFVPEVKSNIKLNSALALPELELDSHKYQRGVVLVQAGAKGGAAELAGITAMRVGAGLVIINGVTSAQESSLISENQPLAESLADERRNVVVLGCGNGVSAGTKENVLLALSKTIDCVIDADGLSSFADEPEVLFQAIKTKPAGGVILTPHAGEFVRLFKLKGTKIEQAQQAAITSGAVIVFKGNDTIIASPEGDTIINAFAPAVLAKGGTGDVLAGLIGGLLAQGLEPLAAAAYGVYLHSRLGQAAEEELGETLLASDLPNLLPAVLEDED